MVPERPIASSGEIDDGESSFRQEHTVNKLIATLLVATHRMRTFQVELDVVPGVTHTGLLAIARSA